MIGFFLSTLLVSVLSHCVTATYVQACEHVGEDFLTGFDFFTDEDPTSGHVQYQSLANAQSAGLVQVLNGTNSSSQLYLGVDHTNLAPNGRPSVRLTSKLSFNHGLIVADIAHMPGGICGTWPAFWTVGPNWPSQGEIDIVEGVNDQKTNQMTLHSGAGVTLSQRVKMLGTLQTPSCDVNDPNQPKNAGCGISDNNTLTYGTGFNAAGGGVYATEWTSTSIKIWFFTRNHIPSDIQNGSPNPLGWGTPNAQFAGQSNLDSHFQNQQMVFDTTFCGDWAGEIWSQNPVCSKLAPTCEDYVSNNPSAFTDAYWLVNSVRVFEDNGQKITNSSTPSNSSGPSNSSRPSNSSGGFHHGWPVGWGPGTHRPPVQYQDRKRAGGAVLPRTTITS